MKMDLNAEDFRSSEGSDLAARPQRKGKGKTPKRPRRSAERHPHDSDPFVTCSDGNGRNRRHPHKPRGCIVRVPRAGGRRGDDTPPSSGGGGPPPPYRSRESTPGRPLPGSGPRCGDMDTNDNMGFGPEADSSDSGEPLDGGPSGPPGRGPPGVPPGGGPPDGPLNRGPPNRGAPEGPPCGDLPNEPPGAEIPDNIWRWAVYPKMKVCNLERGVQINEIEMGKSAAVAAKPQKEPNIAKFKAWKLSGVVTKLQRRLDRL